MNITFNKVLKHFTNLVIIILLFKFIIIPMTPRLLALLDQQIIYRHIIMELPSDTIPEWLKLE